jgi:hypothetical protein
MKNAKSMVLPLVLLITVVLLWYFIGYDYVNNHFGEADRGPFGDQFGVVNALFTGLTFAGLFYTILLQRKQMDQQREEISITKENLSVAHDHLAATREELDLSNREFKEQNKTMTRQRFESTFFSLLSMFQTNITTLPEGRQFFTALISRMKQPMGFEIQEGSEKRHTDLLAHYYHSHTVNHMSGIYLYVDNLLTLLKYVEDSKLIEEDEKGLFNSIIISNIGKDEKSILFYFMVFEDEEDVRKLDLILYQRMTDFLDHLTLQVIQVTHLDLFEWE